jgi:acetyl-CoA carboxylase carboxyltransferase component
VTDADADELRRQLEEREAALREPGGPARVARQRRLGRMTGRERVEALVDAGSFVELGAHVLHKHAHVHDTLAANRHPGDGVVAGLGTVGGRPVVVVANEPTILRGAVGHAASLKVCRALDLARDRGIPVITLADSDGVRVEEGLDAVTAYGEILLRVARLQGKVPQLTVVFGLCVGAAAYAAALGDFVAMVDGQSYLFITGPKVTKVVTGEDTTLDALGGPAMHARTTGQCHAILPDEASAIVWAKQTLGALERTRETDDPLDRPTPELATLIPTAERRAYDVKKVVHALFDRGSFLEVSERFAKNLVTGFARLGGRSVAVVASQPMVLAGTLDVDASRKGAAFVRFAGAHGIPVITLVDVPGYLPGTKQEQGGILPHGATLIDAYAHARSPLLCLILRKSYGGASVLSFGSAVRLALPTARVGAVGIDAQLEIELGPESPTASPDEKAARAARREAFVREHGHGWAAAEGGYVDRVVEPARAREALARALGALVDEGAR